LLASAVGAVTYLALFSGNINIVNRVSTESKVETAEPAIKKAEQELVTPSSLMVNVEEEYRRSINTEFELQELRNSPLVDRIEIQYEGSPVSRAFVHINNVKVIDISNDRVLTVNTVNEDSNPLSIYIGHNIDGEVILVFTTEKGSMVEPYQSFGVVKEGDVVSIYAIWQIGRGDPLRPTSIMVFR